MDVMIVYPPFVSDSRAFPPLSLAALRAHLRRHDVSVDTWDGNIDLCHELVSEAALARFEASMAARLANAPSRCESLDSLEYYCALADAVHLWLPHIRWTMRRHAGDIRTLDSDVCLNILDRLTAIMYLQMGLQQSIIERDTPDILAPVVANHPSELRRWVERSFLPRLEAATPRVLGMSLMVEHQLFPALVMAWHAKRLLPNLHVTFGGGFIGAIHDKVGTRSPEVFSLVDSFVGFDGEHALLALVQSVKAAQPLTAVPNLVWLDRQAGEVRRAPVRETGPLDALPTPEFDGIDFSRYTRPILPYYVSKGCSYGRCAYCSDPAYSSPRDRSAMNAADQLEHLIGLHKPKIVLFVDAYIHPERLEPIARQLIRRGVRVNWVMQTRMDRFLTTERIELFAESGCNELWFGMETVNERLIRLIRKGTKEGIIRRILEDCRRCGIKVTLNCMIGFPTETEAEADDTIGFIESLRDSYPGLTFKCNTGFVFVPRLSDFGRTPDKFGITVVDEYEWSPTLEWLPPAWRLEERFMKLQGQVFAKSYAGAEQRGNGAGVGARRRSIDPETRVWPSAGTYVTAHHADLPAVWRALFRYRAMRADLQRTMRYGKAMALQRVDEAIRDDTALAALFDTPRRLIYVADERASSRRVVPSNDAYALVMRNIPADGVSFADLVARIGRLYPAEDQRRTEDACRYAVDYLSTIGALESDARELDVADRAADGPIWNKRNFGAALPMPAADRRTGVAATDDLDDDEAEAPALAKSGAPAASIIKLRVV